MHFGPVRVNADLHGIHSQIAHAIGLFLADHEGIGLDLDAERKFARIFQDAEEVHAHQDLAAAQSQEERAGIGQLVEDTEHLGRSHFAVIVVIEITVHAPLVAPIGDIQLSAQGHSQREGAAVHLFH